MATAQSTNAQTPSRPRNLLFITTDQQRWDSLPCYGLDFMRTPNLDRLAREGVVFERAYTPAPLCVPMRAAMLAGQWPATLGVLDNNQWFRRDHPGLSLWPQVATEAGYRTAAIGKMHFQPWDEKYGFVDRISAEDKRQFFWPDDYEKFLRLHGIEKHHPIELPGYYEHLQASVFPHPKRFHVDAYVGDQAADWLRRYARPVGEPGALPFAAWVSFPGPHDPYDPPEEMASMYDDAPIPEPIPPAADAVEPVRSARGVKVENPLFQLDLAEATPQHYRRWRAHYYANVSLIDEGIGKMLAALEERGALEDTVIVFTSDHGDALGDHGLAYKSFFYEWGARVPLLVRGPGVARGARCAALVSTLDLVPLFYRTCGVEVPAAVQGVDPTPLLADPSGRLRTHVVSELQGRVMVRDERYKYVQYQGAVSELFDLQEDPREVRNLASDLAHAGEVARMRALLVEHFMASDATRAVASRVPDAWHRAHQRCVEPPQ
jgi:arylsulfatase